MNILKRELRNNLKSIIIWSLSMVFLIYAGMVKYSAFQKTGESANELFKDLPKFMLSIFGVDNAADITSVSVFYSIFFIYFALMAGVHALMLGAIIISKEERDKTADFLFVKPVKRKHIISMKIIAALINILIFNLVTFFVSILLLNQYEDKKSLLYPVFLICVALFMLQLLFLGIGLFLGAVSKSSKKATAYGTLIILSVFILKVLMDLNKDLDFFRIVSPFKYFSSTDIMLFSKMDWQYMFIAIFLTIIPTILTYYFFGKRNLK